MLTENKIKEFFKDARFEEKNKCINNILEELAYISSSVGRINNVYRKYNDKILINLEGEVIDTAIIKQYEEARQRAIEIDINNMKTYFSVIKDSCINLKSLDGDCFEEYDKFKKEIRLIEKHKSCKKISFDSEESRICIETNDLIIHEPITEKNFFLGNMVIYIPTNTEYEIIMENPKNQRLGYDDQMMNHPHTFNSGLSCFGNISTQIVLYRNTYDYYALYLLLLSFLKTCNINDSAGMFVASWDECDEDGNIIDTTLEQRVLLEDGRILSEWYTCSNCYTLLDVDDVYECTKCGNIYCRDCAEWHNDRPYCGCCYDNLSVCTECGKPIDTDNDEYEMDEYDELICEDCAEEIRRERERIKFESA